MLFGVVEEAFDYRQRVHPGVSWNWRTLIWVVGGWRYPARCLGLACLNGNYNFIFDEASNPFRDVLVSVWSILFIFAQQTSKLLFCGSRTPWSRTFLILRPPLLELFPSMKQSGSFYSCSIQLHFLCGETGRCIRSYWDQGGQFSSCRLLVPLDLQK